MLSICTFLERRNPNEQIELRIYGKSNVYLCEKWLSIYIYTLEWMKSVEIDKEEKVEGPLDCNILAFS